MAIICRTRIAGRRRVPKKAFSMVKVSAPLDVPKRESTQMVCLPRRTGRSRAGIVPGFHFSMDRAGLPLFDGVEVDQGKVRDVVIREDFQGDDAGARVRLERVLHILVDLVVLDGDLDVAA